MIEKIQSKYLYVGRMYRAAAVVQVQSYINHIVSIALLWPQSMHAISTIALVPAWQGFSGRKRFTSQQN